MNKAPTKTRGLNDKWILSLLPEVDEDEPQPKASPDGLWNVLQSILSDAREQRLAFLMYHCGLNPAAIISLCPQEFSDPQEIVRLHRAILSQMLRHATHLKMWIDA
jgi:hypothetical protein